VRLLLALERPDAGVVRFDGHELSSMSEASIRPLRRRFQPVFQDSLAALDPRMPIGKAVVEPLVALAIGDPGWRRRRIAEVLEQVGLPIGIQRRLPAGLSGGERQRVAIARALAGEPELLILDEPVSSLDATVALQVIDLLHGLRRRLGLTLVLVTHDVNVASELCERVVVMHEGRIVEAGETERVFEEPQHEYTKRLLDAVLTLNYEL
jgi:peptide/nickel transport system ATP-binding protein